jgi:hypothetical protein
MESTILHVYQSHMGSGPEVTRELIQKFIVDRAYTIRMMKGVCLSGKIDCPSVWHAKAVLFAIKEQTAYHHLVLHDTSIMIWVLWECHFVMLQCVTQSRQLDNIYCMERMTFGTSYTRCHSLSMVQGEVYISHYSKLVLQCYDSASE